MNYPQCLQLFQQKQVALFCGSELSQISPAGLIAPKKFVQETEAATLPAWCRETGDREAEITHCDCGDDKMEILAPYCGEILSALEYGWKGEPNDYHRQIARLVHQGYLQIIFTTVGSRYFEQSLAQYPDVEVEVVNSEIHQREFLRKVADGEELDRTYIIPLHSWEHTYEQAGLFDYQRECSPIWSQFFSVFLEKYYLALWMCPERFDQSTIRFLARVFPHVRGMILDDASKIHEFHTYWGEEKILREDRIIPRILAELLGEEPLPSPTEEELKKGVELREREMAEIVRRVLDDRYTSVEQACLFALIQTILYEEGLDDRWEVLVDKLKREERRLVRWRGRSILHHAYREEYSTGPEQGFFREVLTWEPEEEATSEERQCVGLSRWQNLVDTVEREEVDSLTERYGLWREISTPNRDQWHYLLASVQKERLREVDWDLTVLDDFRKTVDPQSQLELRKKWACLWGRLLLEKVDDETSREVFDSILDIEGDFFNPHFWLRTGHLGHMARSVESERIEGGLDHLRLILDRPRVDLSGVASLDDLAVKYHLRQVFDLGPTQLKHWETVAPYGEEDPRIHLEFSLSRLVEESFQIRSKDFDLDRFLAEAEKGLDLAQKEGLHLVELDFLLLVLYIFSRGLFSSLPSRWTGEIHRWLERYRADHRYPAHLVYYRLYNCYFHHEEWDPLARLLEDVDGFCKENSDYMLWAGELLKVYFLPQHRREDCGILDELIEWGKEWSQKAGARFLHHSFQVMDLEEIFSGEGEVDLEESQKILEELTDFAFSTSSEKNKNKICLMWITLFSISIIHRDNTRAVEVCERAEELFHQFGKLSFLPRLYWGRSALEHSRNNSRLSKKYLKKSIAANCHCPDNLPEIETVLYQAEGAVNYEMAGEAGRLLDQLEEFISKSGDRYNEQESCILLGKIWELRGWIYVMESPMETRFEGAWRRAEKHYRRAGLRDKARGLKREIREFLQKHKMLRAQQLSTAKPLTSAKVGPNDPCPCGSGKKYKKCCS